MVVAQEAAARSANCGAAPPVRKVCPIAEPFIDRDEVVALLFNVSGIAVTLKKVQRLLEENDGEEEETDGG